MNTSEHQEIRQLFDDYLQMYASRDDRLTTYFSDDFSGFTGGGDFLVKNREEWVTITRQDFDQVKDPIRIELKDLAIQSLAETIAVATGFFNIHLPIEDQILSRETARLVLIFRKEHSGWKISHSSISIPYYLVREGEVYPLKELVERNQFLEEQTAERAIQLSETMDRLQQANKDLAKEIAEHQHIEMELRKSEEKFSTAFRVSPDAININRLIDGMYIDVNEGFTAITDYTPEEVIGKTSLELNIWDNLDDRFRLTNTLKEHGIVNSLEVQFKRKDGSTLTGLMSARVIDIDGESCLLSITRDISDRKQAEDYLRQSEKHLRSLMDAMPAAIWWFDKDGTIEYMNKCFVNQFGYSLDDIPTLNDWFFRAYPNPEYREHYLATREALIAEAIKNGTIVQPRETKINCKNGEQCHLIINTQHVLGRTIEIFTDITAREIFHEQLQKIDKLQSLGVLAGGIAHDFNNILTSIMGNISFARTFIDESHKASALLLNAEKATNRAADLAHQLLTFAKGGQPVKKAVSLRHILEESALLVLHGSNVSCDINIPDDLSAVEVDEGQISQVVNNIIINAAHSMPGGGIITIKAEHATIDAANILSLIPGNYIRLSISDTGCGISEEDQKRIFDPYFTTKSSGSGLGLASAHSIISKHGGYISVCSTVNKGSTFEILLPTSDKQPIQSNVGTTVKPSDKQSGLSVLVMDDEEMIRDLVTQMLIETGYSVQTCSNGVEAVQLYKNAYNAGEPYSAVITDLTIPGGMGGREAAQRILEINPEARLIVSSGYSTDPIMSDYSLFGYCARLQKPFTVVEINSVLSSALTVNP
jgi:PAS domain S-box-containing protein